MNFILAATFKSNKTSKEVDEWVKAVVPKTKGVKAEVIVAPSYPYLYPVHNLLTSSESLKLAAQDVSPFPPGSYTGAVNAKQLKDLGVTYCLVGHSERRRYFHETPADIANKIDRLTEVGITPILCVAENDIFTQLAALSSEQKDAVVYCFEPPAEIGGTVTAPLGEIKRVVGLIRTAVPGNRVMYGGSVNAGNIAGLLELELDGVLVSSASLDPAGFLDIVKIIS